ncbi:unnamed protein product, partial [Mesorhabditis belari]|uniref:BZIP domain-containing protein n=1 Tax=Mesorhabditis belari TaxID=2138241 RepID=A0AAF3EGK6_9BILA
MMAPNSMLYFNQSVSPSCSSEIQPTQLLPFPVLNPQLFFLPNAFTLPFFNEIPSSNSASSERSSPASSPENLDDTSSQHGSIKAGGKVKRGRPQQEIHDDLEDPNSQKRKHRRLYARQYRAQMRQKIDEVKKLQDDLAEVKRKHQDEIAGLNQIITNLIQINQQLMPTVFASSSPKRVI